MPARSKPLTPEQQAAIYDVYTRAAGSLVPETVKPTMKSLALQYQVSVSVIHRAIHNEAYRRGLMPIA